MEGDAMGILFKPTLSDVKSTVFGIVQKAEVYDKNIVSDLVI